MGMGYGHTIKTGLLTTMTLLFDIYQERWTFGKKETFYYDIFFIAIYFYIYFYKKQHFTRAANNYSKTLERPIQIHLTKSKNGNNVLIKLPNNDPTCY